MSADPFRLRLSVQLLFQFFRHFLHAALFKGKLQPHFGYHAGEEIGGGKPAELQIALPGSLIVLIHPQFILEGHGLRDYIVDIIEGEAVDMVLLLPVASLSEEGISLIIQMRLISVSYTHLDVYKRQHQKLLTDRKWGAPEGYDLCINTTNLEIKKIIPGLKEMALCWFE